MDWVDRMNKAIDYIEEHLTEEISEKEINNITACSFSMFQGSFTQITGVSLSEYLRRRKLTCAAYELQNTDEKVIDISLKYGYNSADAFTVAFKRLHGVTPTEARFSGVTLTFYCRIRFSLKIEGVDKMDYTTIERSSFKVIGIRRTTPYGGGTWAIVKSDGSNEKIKEISGIFYDLGLCFGFGDDGSNDYMCGIEWDKEDIEGLDTYQYPSVTWLKFEANGSITGQTLGGVWKRIHEEFLPQSKYKLSGLPTIEKYVKWDDADDMCIVEIWLPVALK
ncbi:AraC family transcriptional regulator [Anaerocolumna chitinilytica]|uniref:Putative HTH-type transcriptional regulator YdeE n=1 Tax=Anaerocolumna chitinilytica TaxID=1727145 RepID=A0A7I8DM58_9FIRM|nr:GyrI-like domain-containing protein [Anaerocolumna chitinilytica]BCJ99460.1 putative HTH-type transcriptional regulator YdeE [Anaerocolumna chitinilytica]